VSPLGSAVQQHSTQPLMRANRSNVPDVTGGTPAGVLACYIQRLQAVTLSPLRRIHRESPAAAHEVWVSLLCEVWVSLLCPFCVPFVLSFVLSFVLLRAVNPVFHGDLSSAELFTLRVCGGTAVCIMWVWLPCNRSFRARC
jgi:hypothetical protein